MTTLTLDLPQELIERLNEVAERQRQPVDVIVRDWLEERLPSPDPQSDREAVRDALRAAGLLTELGPKMKERADRSTATLEDVRASLDRASYKPLSEVILEMRGSKQ